MFKRALAILLLVTLTASSFQRYFIYAGFELNRSYIAENFCINKSRPWMHCNGRCYFMRKIRQAEENEKKQAEKDSMNRIEISFFQEPVVIDFRQAYTIQTNDIRFAEYHCLYAHSHANSHFRPPQA